MKGTSVVASFFCAPVIRSFTDTSKNQLSKMSQDIAQPVRFPYNTLGRLVRPLKKSPIFICFVLAILFFALVLNSHSMGPAASPSRLNLLLITVDTLRADRVSSYSPRHLQTPNMDILAAKGGLFTRAFANSTTTLPSHTNILLGATPSYHGVHDNANFVVRGEFLTLAEHLKSAGYATGAFLGGFPLDARFGLNQGFDVYDDDFSRAEAGVEKGRERRAQTVVDSALKWLAERKSPWFLWIHLYDPHDPYAPPEPYKTRFSADLYNGEVAYTDAVIGNLIRALEQNDRLVNTALILTGDHGESLGEHGEKTHGYLAYNTTLWIPLIILSPGLKHRVISANVSHIDIFPTACDLLDLPKPDFLQGISLRPLLQGGKIADRDSFFESLSPFYNMGWGPIVGYIRNNEKYIDSPIPELYDLAGDFDEKQNQAGSKDLAGYKKRLDQIFQRLASAASLTAGQKMDRETRDRLRSLGYLASLEGSRKKTFRPEDDVKVLLPYQNKSMAALDLFAAGKAKEAIQALREIITARGDIKTAYLNLAMIYKSQGRLDDAVAVLEAGQNSLPENYELYAETIAYLCDAGRFSEAIHSFERKSPRERELDPVVWVYAGLAYWKMGNNQNAIELYEKSISIDPKYAVPHTNLGTLLAFEFKKTNDPATFQKSMESYEQSIRLDSTTAYAFHGLGVLNFQAKNYDQAIPNLSRALELDPGLDEAVLFLGLAHLAKKDYARAYQYFIKYKKTSTYDRLTPQEKARLEEYIAASNKGMASHR
jgi:arylsulfatase A-like enzyme/Tfp pilus assembly protein PilF